jgi:hypothetical protein
MFLAAKNPEKGPFSKNVFNYLMNGKGNKKSDCRLLSPTFYSLSILLIDQCLNPCYFKVIFMIVIHHNNISREKTRFFIIIFYFFYKIGSKRTIGSICRGWYIRTS